MVLAIFWYISNCSQIYLDQGTIPAPYLSVPLNIIINQGVIPITMIMSLIWLKIRYRIIHYLAALIIIGGIALDVFPDFNSTTSWATMFWIVLLFSANIPQSANNVYKEIALKQQEIDLWYFGAWSGLFQLLFGIVMGLTVFIPLPKPAEIIKPNDFGNYLVDSFLCFLGTNSRPGDKCDFTWLVFVVYINFNVSMSLLMLYIMKKGSATLAVIAAAGRLVISNIGFLIPFVAGEALKESFTWFDIVSLIMVVIGIILYRSMEEIRPITDSENQNIQYEKLPDEDEPSDVNIESK